MKSFLLLTCLVGLTSATVCPGGNITCSGDATCCRISSGGYGCCPFPNAECCPDLIHCCMEGYSCALGECVPKSLPLTEITKQNMVCPDPEFSCPDGYTCCTVVPGFVGCCPLPDAVCCSDGLHCCPEGTTCDLASQTCNSQPKLYKQRLISRKHVIHLDDDSISNELTFVDCGGGSMCPDGSTCCKLPDGSWGCCPLPNAVCCDDRIHCCPSGTTCSASSCQQASSSSHPLVKQRPASIALHGALPHVTNVVCPGGEYQCPDDNTCCKLSSGAWGCCPMPQATCCDDGEHCCPHGSTCYGGRCYTKSSSIPWFQKVKATQRPKLKKPIFQI